MSIFNKAHLTNGVALHRENSPDWNQSSPSWNRSSPKQARSKGPGVHSGDSPDSWWMCHGASKALFLILQKSKSSQRRNLGQFGEGKKRISFGQRKPQQLLGQPLPFSPQQPRDLQPKWRTGCDWGTALQLGKPDALTWEILQTSTLPEERG